MYLKPIANEWLEWWRWCGYVNVWMCKPILKRREVTILTCETCQHALGRGLKMRESEEVWNWWSAHQAAASCGKLQQAAATCSKLQQVAASCDKVQQGAASCDKLQQVAANCNKLQQAAASGSKFRQAATSYKTSTDCTACVLSGLLQFEMDRLKILWKKSWELRRWGPPGCP